MRFGFEHAMSRQAYIAEILKQAVVPADTHD